MARIEKRRRSDGRTSWRAHYRTPSGEQRNKTCDLATDALVAVHAEAWRRYESRDKEPLHEIRELVRAAARAEKGLHTMFKSEEWPCWNQPEFLREA